MSNKEDSDAGSPPWMLEGLYAGLEQMKRAAGSLLENISPV